MRAEGPGLEAIGFRLKLPASLGVEDLLAGKPPRAREAGGGIPLIVFLNGSGSSGVDNSLQLSPPAVLSFFLSPALGEAIILSPQCPIGASWDSNAWLDSAGPTFDPVPTKAMNTLLAIVERLEEAYPVDLRRVSIMGFSLGAFGALEAAIRSPRMFSKAVSIAGGADTKAIAKASGVSFRIYHGEQDSNVSVGMARALASALKSYGFDFSYREFPGQNHDVRALALGDPGLIPWLLETGDRD
jgi:predicted peptidase